MSLTSNTTAGEGKQDRKEKTLQELLGYEKYVDLNIMKEYTPKNFRERALKAYQELLKEGNNRRAEQLKQVLLNKDDFRKPYG